MAKTEKRKNKYTVVLSKTNDLGETSSFRLGPSIVEVIAIAVAVLTVFFLCKFIYDTIVIKSLRSQLIEQVAMVNNLTDENETLTVENDTLLSKVAVLSETVSKKAATEDALTQEETNNALPKGFPMNGTSTMELSELDGKPIVKFVANTGVNIISSGKGTVVGIEEDAEYGNRIIIDHGNGYKSVYRNKGEVLVKNGAKLGKGYILFAVDNSNQNMGYQIVLDNEYINPMEVMEING